MESFDEDAVGEFDCCFECGVQLPDSKQSDYKTCICSNKICQTCIQTQERCVRCFSTKQECFTLRCLHCCRYQLECSECEILFDESEEKLRRERYEDLKWALEREGLDIHEVKDFYIELYINSGLAHFRPAPLEFSCPNSIVIENELDLACIIATHVCLNYKATGQFGIGCMHTHLQACDCLCNINDCATCDEDCDDEELCEHCSGSFRWPWQTPILP